MGLAKIIPLPPSVWRKESRPLPEATKRFKVGSVFLPLTLVLFALGGFWLAVAISQSQPPTGIGQLPPALRGPAFGGTMTELESVCRNTAAATGELRDHCVEQARFARKFPECAEVCQRLTSLLLAHPPR